MSLHKSGAATPNFLGQETLYRYTEWRQFLTGLNNGDAAGLLGINRNGGGALPQTMLRLGVGSTTPTYQNVNERRSMQVATTAVAPCYVIFRPWVNAANPIQGLGRVFPAVTGPVSVVPPAGTWGIQAWLRKLAAGSATDCRTTFGYSDLTVFGSGAARINARCGLVGDGLQGFRFGSVNCPDGVAAGDNAATDIDAGFIQPAELVNPGASWFHVLILMVPATPTTPSRWAGYLNGRLIKVFDQFANLPRGSQGANRNYAQVEAAIYANFSAAVIPALNVHDLRVYVDDSAAISGS